MAGASRLDQISAEKRALLLKRLRQKKALGEQRGIPPSPRRLRGERDFPLSASQRRIWFLHRLEPENPFYNEMVTLRLRGRLDLAALDRSFNEIIRRHEILRSRFVTVDGEPRQRVEPYRPRPLVRIDLTGLAADRREHELQRWLPVLGRQIFDLEGGEVLHVRLLQLAPEVAVWALTCHHIVGDHWAISIVMSELSQLYAAFRRGLPSPLPELPIQYADFADWQSRWQESDAFSQHLDFWRRQLDGAPPTSLLPPDRRRSVQRFRGSLRFVELPAALLDRLKALGRSSRATLFMTLLAAFNAVLYRHSGQRDLVLGSPSAGRDRVELEPLIGCFLNMVALRTRVDGDRPFSDLLATARETTLAAFEHQSLPFERLVEELPLARDLSHEPVFQILFNLMNVRMENLQLDDLEVIPEPAELETVKIALDIYLEERPDGLHGILLYDVDLYDGTTLDRFWRHHARFLEAVAEDPRRRVDEVPLLGRSEVQQLSREWNERREEALRSDSLLALLTAQEARTPEAVALVDGERTLSYRALHRRAARLAARLERLIGGEEPLIALAVDGGVERTLAWLAVLRAGAAYLPLDPHHPAERLRYIVDHAGVAGLLGDGTAPEALSVPFWDLGEQLRRSASEDAESRPRHRRETGLAYVIYTSGSTGRPKGVEITRGGVHSLVEAMLERPGISARDVLLAVITPTFDMSVFEIYVPLASGARVVLASTEETADGALLSRRLRDSRASVMQATPISWRLLVDAGHVFAPGFRALAGGEALPPELARRLLDGGAELWNMYGPTEITVYAALTRLRSAAVVPIGRPVTRGALFVVDRRLALQPIGVAGELWIGGRGLARGYRRAPAQTATRFLPDPFTPERGARLYRSGDLVRWLADGRVDYLGRIDFQVKLRGLRIELGEIERVLETHPQVGQAVVVLQRPAGGEARLVACLRRRDDAEAEPPFAAFLRRKLPEYMVPAIYLERDTLPQTSSGKVDRRALERVLSELLAERRETPAAGSPPRTANEEIVAGIFATLLGCDAVGREASFFDLGGHSLLATRAISRVRTAFGVELPLRALFQAPTVAAFTALIETAQRDELALPPAPPIEPRGERGPAPLSFAQERLWFLERLQPGGGLYNLPAAFHLRGALQLAALRAAFAEVVRRHQILRSRFPATDGGPRQEVRAPRPLLRVDLTALPPPVRDRQLGRLKRTLGRHPFDLTEETPLVAALLELGAQRFTLLLTLHHIAGDGWSVGVLQRELGLLYRAFAAGRGSPLAELAVQYADYATWQRRWLEGEVLERHLEHWRRALAGAPHALELPTDRPRRALRSTRGAIRDAAVPAPVAAAFAALCRTQGATLFIGLMAVFQAVLARSAGCVDLVVGTPIAGRDRQEIEPLAGMFVNTLALRGDLGGDPRVRQLIGRTRERTLAALAHQALPFERLVEELRPERDLSRTPIFQVMFVFQGGLEAPRLELDDVVAEPLPVPTDSAKFDLQLTVAPAGDGLASAGLDAALEYSVELFDATTAERLLRRFVRLVTAAAEDPEARLSQLPVASAGERHQLLYEWNPRFEQPASPPTLPAAFERRAAERGDAIAVGAGDAALSYRELDRRSARLARGLRARGVGAETRVGLLLERTPELVTALIATLRAGAAYLPLDPQVPADRVRYILDDAGAALVIAQPSLAALAQSAGGPPVIDPASLAAAAVEGERLPPVEPSQLAYLIYTSGSTGRPKGTLVTHRNVVRLLRAAERDFDFDLDAAGGHQEVWTLFHSIAFDFSVWEIWGALAWGGRLQIVPFWESRAPEDFHRLLLEHRVTVLNQTPSAFRQLVPVATQRPAGSGALRQVIFGGEALQLDALEPWFAIHGEDRPRLINMYGITETTVHVTFRRVLGADVGSAWRSPMGRALADLAVHLLDARGRPTPLGAVGELCVGGAGVCRGYAGRPALSAERMVPDPWSRRPGGRLYRSGDLARWLADGDLEYLGRLDHQVKIRGFRIELGEIESALADHPAVHDAAVMAVGSGDARRLVAWWVRDGDAGDGPPDRDLERELKHHLRGRLPEYMIPAAIAELEALPITASGKLDRRALEALEPRASTERERTPPRTELQQRIAAIWQQVLETEVGIHDNFFDLGGHSLLAVRIHRRLESELQRSLPLMVLFQHTTVAALAEHLSGGEAEAPRLEEKLDRGSSRKAAMQRRRQRRQRGTR